MPAVSTEAITDSEQPGQPPEPQAATAAPADAPAQEPDEAQKSRDRLAQPSTVAGPDVIPQEPPGSAQHSGVTEDGGLSASMSAVKSKGGVSFQAGQSQGQADRDISAVHDSGEQLTHLLNNGWHCPSSSQFYTLCRALTTHIPTRSNTPEQALRLPEVTGQACNLVAHGCMHWALGLSG